MNGYIAKCEGVFKINDEPKSPNNGPACLREVVNRTIRGMFSMYDEPESPNKGGRVIKIYDELLSPNVAFLRYTVIRNPHMRGGGGV